MSRATLSGIRVEGLAAAVPKDIHHNSDCGLIPENERGLFIRSTGIATRRVAKTGICTSDLCHHAASRLMATLGWQPAEIRLIVLVTQTPDHITPATAALLQHRLGCGTHCAAIDINLGCSGYVYGLWAASSLLTSMPEGSKALLLAGDISTATISPEDRSTVPLFSDAASATALVKDSNTSHPMHFALATDGSAGKVICIPDGGYRNPTSPASLVMEDFGGGVIRRRTDLILNGIDVYQQASAQWPQQVISLMEETGITPSVIDFAVFHQANRVINEMVRKRCGLAEQQAVSSLHDLGNSGTASVPVTMAYCLRERLMASPSTLLLSGFGVGMSWATAIGRLETMQAVLWEEV